jgi:hypothetical protein
LKRNKYIIFVFIKGNKKNKYIKKYIYIEYYIIHI